MSRSGLPMLPLLLLLLLLQLSFSAGKVFDRCELSQLLQRQFGMPASQAATLVCIAQHSSSLNTATFGGGSGPGGGSHGLFQISDVYWCSPPGQGAGCGVSCARLRDDDISDDVQCVRKIFAEHQRISGDGFTAWQAYEQYCRHDAASYVAGCGGLGAGFSAGSALIAAASHQPVSYQPVSYQPASYQPVSYQPVRNSGAQVQSKIYNRCELAQELYYNHKMPMQQIPTWVCIAQHESSFNTAAVGRLNTDGSADHGLFQISDLFWCTHDARGGKGCRISCDKLLDKNIADDVQCIKRIHQEHTQISGDGFTAWTVYNRNCRNQRYEQVAACFAKPQAAAPHHPNAIGGGAVVSKTSYVQPQKTTLSSGYYRPTTVVSSQLPSSYLSNPFLRPHISAQAQPHPNAINVPQKAQSHFSLANPFQKYKQQTPFYTNTYTTPQQQPQHLYNHYQRPTPSRSGKVYTRCELAQELFFSHKFPMQDIATWVCIAEHESRFDTSAVGRLNTDGSADHGLFQISDLYWCTHDAPGGKGCQIACDRLLDSDISDDVQCIRTIHEEHTRISGDGFTAWTVYNGHCRQRSKAEIADCFDKNVLSKEEVRPSTSNSLTRTPQAVSHAKPKGKIYKRCELAQELYFKHKIPMQEIPTWVCIAQHESSFNTAAVGRLNTDGSADHGLFQISDLYWCSHDLAGGKACHISCDKLLDSDISDDVQCIKTIYEEHTRLSGDGFTAWTVYNGHCRQKSKSEIAECFNKDIFAKEEERPSSSNSLTRTPQAASHAKPKGKIYKRCELAQELYFKHKIPMQEIPTWVCIAQHESSFNTAAVGRLNTDGSADHGLFQISDLYWCSHDLGGGKACHISCDKLLDSDISDDVQCVKTIYEEHTRISGDGFTAWTVYNGHCRKRSKSEIADCFDKNVLAKEEVRPSSSNSVIRSPQAVGHSKPKGKVYKRCELAQELYFKHKMPMQEIPTWVCIAQHESSYNTAAVGRLNTDGSADHGLFQISDLYWCSHDLGGGKACHISCDKLLDSDISDDIQCVRTIYEEHTRLSGDGFTAWTVYNGHCRHQSLAQLSDCFSGNEIKESQPIHYAEKPQTTTQKPQLKIQHPVKIAANHPYADNPFLQPLIKLDGIKNTVPATKRPTNVNVHSFSQTSESVSKPNYLDNPFLQGYISAAQGSSLKTSPKPTHTFKNNKPDKVSRPIEKEFGTPIQGTKPVQPTLSPQHYKRPYVSSDSFRNEVIKFTATTSTTTTTKRPFTTTTTTRKPFSWQWQAPTTKNSLKTTTRPSTTTRTTVRPTALRQTTRSSPTTTRPTTRYPSTTKQYTRTSATTTRLSTRSPSTTRQTTRSPTTTRQAARPTTTTVRPTTHQKTTTRQTTRSPITTRQTTRFPGTTRQTTRSQTARSTLATKSTTRSPATTPRPPTAAWYSTTPKKTTRYPSYYVSTTPRLTTTTTPRKSTVQYKLPSTTPRPRPSTTPKPYLFDAKTKTTTTTRKSTTTTRSPTNIRNSTASPFDHPFFDKFRAQFDENIASSTNSRKPVITSPYYDKFKQNNALSGSKTVYSYGFGQNGPKTTTIKRPSTQSPTTTRKPASGFDIYLNWNKG